MLLATALTLFFITTAVGIYKCLVRPPSLEGKPHSSNSSGSAQSSAFSDEEAAAAAARAAHLERKDNYYLILISGVDDGNGGSDTNILLSVDAEQGQIHGVSIPRDTKALIHGKTRKINFAYNSGGSELMAQTVSEQLGVPVDFTITVGLGGFSALVNAIGGVDFYVPVNMDYDDPVQDLHIHFTKGLHHLTGKEAMEVVRFRHNNDGTGYGSEDIGRMQTQQDFLKAVAKKVLQPANLTRVSEFVRIFDQYVDTDLSLGNLAWLGETAFSAGPENISFTTLPGEWIPNYIYLDPDATLAMVNEYLNPYVEDRVAEDLALMPRPS